MAVEDSSHTNQFHMASPQRTADATDREIAMTPNNQSIDVGAASSETGIIYFCINSSAKCVGLFCTPKQIVILMRLLKAFTFCFLVLNICSEMMFLLFVAFMNADALFDGAGSARDNIIRINGMLLSMIAISIELDLELSRSHFPGFRPYIPRSFLLLFIAVISEAQVTLSNTDNNVDDYGIDDSMIQREIPGSAIVFDAVTSFILYGCAMGYFFLGALCCDRYSSRALLAPSIPSTTTEISSSRMIGTDYGEPATPYKSVSYV